jgi:hypothetical protein
LQERARSIRACFDAFSAAEAIAQDKKTLRNLRKLDLPCEPASLHSTAVSRTFELALRAREA